MNFIIHTNLKMVGGKCFACEGQRNGRETIAGATKSHAPLGQAELVGCANEILTPIKDCSYQDREDGCCGHDSNMTPECHHGACPRLSGEILDKLR